MIKNKFKIFGLMCFSLVSITSLSFAIVGCSNNKNSSPNDNNISKETKKPTSLLENNIVTKLNDDSLIESIIDTNSLELHLTLDNSYKNKDIKIFFSNKTSDLFDLTDTNFSLNSNYKFLDGDNYKYSNEQKYVELTTNDLPHFITIEIFEENKTSQQVIVDIKFNFINNSGELEFLKLQDCGIILNDIKINAYAKLISDLNLVVKDMDFSSLTNQIIKDKLNNYKDVSNNNIYKDINLMIDNESNSYNNKLVLNISGQFKTFIIQPTKIIINNIFSYIFPENKTYKLNSNIELKNKFIIDLKNENDIKLLSSAEIINYLEPFVCVDINANDQILNVDPSKFKSIQIEFEDNLSIKKISGSFDVTLYNNDSWTKEEKTITFVDKSIIHFGFNYSVKYFSQQEILDILVNNFVVVNNDAIRNSFPSKLDSDFINNKNSLPLSIDKEKVDRIATKYFNNNKTFIFEYLNENSFADDFNGTLELSFNVTNESNEYIQSSKTVVVNNLLKFNDVYKNEIDGLENNSSLIKETYTNNLINDISLNKETLNKINNLKENETIVLENFDNRFLKLIDTNKHLRPDNINNLINNVSLKMLAIDINNSSWNIDTNIFDNSFKLENIFIDLSEKKQKITKSNNGFRYILNFKYILNISQKEISINGEFYTKISGFNK